MTMRTKKLRPILNEHREHTKQVVCNGYVVAFLCECRQMIIFDKIHKITNVEDLTNEDELER